MINFPSKFDGFLLNIDFTNSSLFEIYLKVILFLKRKLIVISNISLKSFVNEDTWIFQPFSVTYMMLI